MEWLSSITPWIVAVIWIYLTGCFLSYALDEDEKPKSIKEGQNEIP